MTGAALQFNAQTVAPSKPLDPIPSGWYNAQIVDSKMEPTSKPGGQMLKLEFQILDGQFAGRKVFDRLNLVNDNPQAQQIAWENLSAICHSVGVINIQQSTMELHGKPLKVKVKLKLPEVYTDQQGNTKQSDGGNEVKGYDAYNSQRATGPSTPVTAGGVAGAPVGQAPWAGQGPVGPAAPMGPPAPAFAPPAAPAPMAPAGFPAPAVAPPAQFQPPVAAAQPWAQPQAPAPVAAPAAPFVPPAPVAPPVLAAPVMLPAANGVTYEAYRGAGWSDEQMIAAGVMAAPQPVAPPAPAMPPAPPAAAPVPAAPPMPGAAPTAPWAR